MTGFGSCAYVGTVAHKRLRPSRHAFRYGVFALLLDVDGIDALAARVRWFSRNRLNLLSFHDRDHGAGDGPVGDHARRTVYHQPAGRPEEAANHRIRDKANGAAGARQAEPTKQNAGKRRGQPHHDHDRCEQIVGSSVGIEALEEMGHHGRPFP